MMYRKENYKAEVAGITYKVYLKDHRTAHVHCYDNQNNQVRICLISSTPTFYKDDYAKNLSASNGMSANDMDKALHWVRRKRYQFRDIWNAQNTVRFPSSPEYISKKK